MALILETSKKKRAMPSEEFEDNELVVDAILRNQEIISEAVKNILEEIRLKYPYIECRKNSRIQRYTYSYILWI